VDVPVLVLDLDEREAAKLLALHDPLAALAEANSEVFAELLAHVETESDAVQSLFDSMLGEPAAAMEEAGDESERVIAIPEAFQVVVECRDEIEQQSVYERMTGEGYVCKLLML